MIKIHGNTLVPVDVLRKIEDDLCLTDGVSEIVKKWQVKLPYHINLVDILFRWANEDKHSLILAELLKQNHGGNYEILASFLNQFINSESSFNLTPVRPVVSNQSDRIDVLITDKNYALIIENKIHGAVDQHSQLSRYIHSVAVKGYNPKNIFVIYLTRDGNKEASDYSWHSKEDKNIKKQYADGYFPLSYRYDILPWMKDAVLPDCRLKDVFMRSAIEQYIDHLEGMFTLRKGNEKMDTEIKDYIKDKLSFNREMR